MNKIVLTLLFCIMLQFNGSAYSKKREGKYDENPLPYFRRKMEEALDNPPAADQTESPSNIVTFLVQNLKEIFHETYEDLDSKNNLFIPRAKDDLISSSNGPTISEPLLSIEDKYNLFNSDFDDIMKSLTAKTEKNDQNDGTTTQTSTSSTATDDDLIRRQKYKLFETFIQRLLTQRTSTSEWISQTTLYDLKPTPSFDYKNLLHSIKPLSAKETNSDNHKFIETPASDFRHSVTKKSRDKHTFCPFLNQCSIDYSKGLKFCSYYLNHTDVTKHHTDVALKSTVTHAPMPCSTSNMEMENATSILFLGHKHKRKTTVNMRTEGVKIYEPTQIDELENVTRQDDENNLSEYKGDTKSQQSCIMCDNVAVRYCHAPKNKLIPSTLCETSKAKCYSMHTPFGIVDRGCYNLDHNMSIYVCSCNLCNHIHHNAMPVMFKDKKEWAANVYEMSHHRRLRKSVHTDMACLRCEVNVSAGLGDLTNDAMDCLEGQISSLPTQTCNRNEVCAVRALKNQGYVWRGCVNFPLYNYYLTLCDEDLCNYDPVISIYENDY